MTTNNTPSPTLKQLEDSARRLLNERVLSKGGAQPSQRALEMAVKFLAQKAQRKGLPPPPPTPTTNPMPQDAPNIDVARQKLELLSTEELETMATMHISFKDNCQIETRRGFYQTQDLVLEILKSR